MTAEQPMVRVRGVSVNYQTDYGFVSAVDDVSFDIPAGASLGLVGESGSGKSTMALAMLRLLPASASLTGEISFDGTDLLGLPEDELRRAWRWKQLSMVFQKSFSALSPVHRIGHQMNDILREREPKLSREERRVRIAEVFAAVRLPDRVYESYPFELSGGMMQRTMIGLALICDPPFVIFDEATTALDVITQAQVLKEVERLKEELNLTTMVISHDVGVINAITDVVGVLYAGQLMELAPRDRFFAAPRHPYSQALLRSVPSVSGVKKTLAGIPGSLPDLTNPPKGCRFSPRCPHANVECLERTPPMIEVEPGHLVRCTEFQMRTDQVQ